MIENTLYPLYTNPYPMVKPKYPYLVLSLFTLFVYQAGAQTITIDDQVFKIDTLYPAAKTSGQWRGLSYPWEVTYGPDDSLWVTETRGYRIVKIHPANKGSRTILNLNNLKDFSYYTAMQAPQGGLMGLAIHPQLLSGKPYVYVALVYHRNDGGDALNNDNCQYGKPAGNDGPCYYTTKILRYTYNVATSTLASPVTVLDRLNGSNDHNSGRLTIGPVESDGQYHLYYTVGDMGAGQFNNLNRPNNAQNTNIYEGKVLRLNTEPDADADDGFFNRWIPNDNPFTHTVTGHQSAVFTFGHRNAQGVVWGNAGGTWRLYSSEHGDVSDDEVNILESGRNYGWPFVAGYADNNYTIHDGSAYPKNDKLAGKNIGYEDTFAVNHNVKEPIFTFFSPDKTIIQGYDWPSNAANYWPNIYTWQTVAPSSIDFYDRMYIPNWRNSLLVTSLKFGMFRLKLNTTGTGISGDTIRYLTNNRVRDLAINPTGDTLFFAIDSSGSTSGPTGGFSGSTVETRNPGFILRMVYMKTLPQVSLPERKPTPPVHEMVKIYPNPASNTLYVAAPKNTSKPLVLRVFDMNGRQLFELQNNKDIFAINLRSAPRGIYIVKLYNGIGINLATEKVIIQ